MRVTFDGPLQGDWSSLIRGSLLGLGWDGYMDDLSKYVQKEDLLAWIGLDWHDSFLGRVVCKVRLLLLVGIDTDGPSIGSFDACRYGCFIPSLRDRLIDEPSCIRLSNG